MSGISPEDNVSPEEMFIGETDGVLPPEGLPEMAEEAEEAAVAAERASKKAKAAALYGATEFAVKAAAQAAEAAAKAAAAAGAAAAAAAAANQPTNAQPVSWLKSPFIFIRRGLRDFMTNLKLTWPIILAFIIYLLGSASVLYEFLRVPAQISSWPQAVYDTWVSMSTAGELATRSSRWVWVLGAANSLAGLLFFGFIVWLVTTSLYRSPQK